MGTALTIASIAASVGGQIFGGLSAKKAADAEAESITEQANIQRLEDEEDARRIDKEHKRFLAKQSLMFLKGGVTLADTPLLILKETREEGRKQVEAKRRQASARFVFGLEKAARTSATGRSKLIGGLFSGFSSGFNLTSKARAAGIF